MQPRLKTRVSTFSPVAAILTPLALVGSSPGLAAWQPDGVPLSPAPTSTTAYWLRGTLADRAQGALAMWLFYDPLPNFEGTHFQLSAQRVDVLGNRPAPWVASGAPIYDWANNVSFGIQNVTPLPLLSDGGGGAILPSIAHTFVVEQVSRFQLHRVAPNGSITGVPGFSGSASGYPVLDAAAATDGAGGVVMMGRRQTFVQPPNSPPPGPLFAQRIDPFGALLWTEVEIAPGANVGDGGFSVLEDGAGGGFFAWIDARDPNDPDLYVVRIDANGTIPQDWPTDGVLVCGAYGAQADPRLVSDGLGGVIVMWRDERDGTARVYASAIQATGDLTPGIPVDGRQLPTSDTDDILVNLASDGQGGCFAVRAGRTPSDVVNSHLHRLDGVMLTRPGWLAEGVVLNPLSPGAGAVGLAADGLGGAFVSFRNGFGSLPPQGLYAQHFAADGSPAPGWGSAGYRLAGHGQDSWVVRSGAGAIVLWTDYRPVTHGVYAQRLVPDGPVATELALVSARVTEGRIALHWFAADAVGLVGTLERRSESSDWAPLVEIVADGSGNLRYEDAATPGARVAYRVAWNDAGLPRRTEEVWVDVPGVPRLALSSPRPNPAPGRVSLAVTLAEAAPATLDLLDLAGRRVGSHDLTGLGRGSHVVDLGVAERLAPGLYVIRLTQAGASRSVRLLRTP